MRISRRGHIGRAAGVCVLALAAAACGGGNSAVDSGSSAKDAVQGTPAKPVQVESGQHKITWTDLKEKPHELQAAPTELARGSESDLKNVRLNDKMKGKVPYYLTVTYTNKGDESLERPTPERDFSLASADGQRGERLMIFGSPFAKKTGLPDACTKSGAEKPLAPGGTATACSVIMMPEEASPAVVSYTGRGADGKSEDPIMWKAGKGRGELPDGVLEFGKPAESSVEDAEGRTVKVQATPKSVRTGTAADLSRFKLDADQKKKVPYYVTVEYRNDGSHKLLPQMNQKMELRTLSGEPARKLTLIDFSGQGFAPCKKAEPDGMVGPKAKVTECAVYLLPKNDSPAALAFTGEGTSATTVTWLAPETAK